MEINPRFPTPLHERAADAVIAFAAPLPVQAVVLVNSCARGVATPQSDLDIALLIDPNTGPQERQSLEHSWARHYQLEPEFREFEAQGPFSKVHLDFFDGQPLPLVWDEGGGPDAFEIEIGNRVAHSVALRETGPAFAALRRDWLPYYGEDLRKARLRMAHDSCRLNLLRVHSAVDRELYFYALDRLYHAFQEFLQALFIARSVYPIAYNKWVREQVQEWLGLDDLYAELPAVLEVSGLYGPGLKDNAHRLEELLTRWASPE